MPLTIADLSFEMLQNVASHLHRKSDLLSLSLTCKALQYPCTMEMFRTVDIYFLVDEKRELDTTMADAILPAMTAVTLGSTSGLTNGSFVKSLRIGLGTTDEVFAADESENEDPIYHYFRRREPNERAVATALCFLHWVANIFRACPDLHTLDMDIPHFSERLFHLIQDPMADVAVAAAGLQALRHISCEDSNLGSFGRGHGLWHQTLLLHRFADLTSLSLQFDSMTVPALLFWENSHTRSTNLVHLKLDYGGFASDADCRRISQVACRTITASPSLQRLSLTGCGGSENFPITADVMAAVASRPHCKELHLTSIGDVRLNQEALDHLRAATNLRCVSIYHAGNFKRLLAFLAHLPPNVETLDLDACGGNKLLERLAALFLVESWCPRLCTMRLNGPLLSFLPSKMRPTVELVSRLAAARGIKGPALEGDLFRRV